MDQTITVHYLIGAHAYACITEASGRRTDIRLEPGRGAAQSLREYAADQRTRAQKLWALADLADLAAENLP